MNFPLRKEQEHSGEVQRGNIFSVKKGRKNKRTNSDPAEKYFRRGTLFSIAVHLGLVLLLALRIPHSNDFQPTEIYSVSIESGATLGGKAQVSRTEEKRNIAPPKKAVEKEQQTPPVEKKKPQPEIQVEKKKVVQEKKVESKPTPVPLKEKAREKPKEKEKAQKETESKAEKRVVKEKPVEKKAVEKKEAPKPLPKKEEKKSVPPAKKEPSLKEIDDRLQKALQRYTGESTDAGGEGFGAAGGTGQGMGGGTQRPPAFFRYRDTLENYIKSGWRWHDQREALVTRICFAISPGGEISSVRICGSSGNSNYDDSAYRAVMKANPVPAPPVEVYRWFKEVRMTFNPYD